MKKIVVADPADEKKDALPPGKNGEGSSSAMEEMLRRAPRRPDPAAGSAQDLTRGRRPADGES